MHTVSRTPWESGTTSSAPCMVDLKTLIYFDTNYPRMVLFFGKKEEKPIENKMPEQSEKQYNLFWMIRRSPFADYSDEEIQEAIDKKLKEINRTLKTQPVAMVRDKSERRVQKLEALSGDREAIATERDQAILHFNRNMIEDNNGAVPTDPAKISATVTREGWVDGQNPVNVDDMPHCPKCGYINRKTKHCVNCGSKLKF